MPSRNISISLKIPLSSLLKVVWRILRDVYWDSFFLVSLCRVSKPSLKRVLKRPFAGPAWYPETGYLRWRTIVFLL